jgi:prepilin signal peptidase PulO-like enzyme (type II secretory pathway)
MLCKKLVKIDGNLYGVKYFFQKCFNFPILDIYFCPFSKYPKRLWQNISFVTIIVFYRKKTNCQKNILLRYIFFRSKGSYFFIDSM